MQDILMTILGIILSVLLLFLFPLMEIVGKTDDISEVVVEIAVSEFANKVASTRKNNRRKL